MKDGKSIERRALLSVVSGWALIPASALLGACESKGDICDESKSGALSVEDERERERVEYQSSSDSVEKACERCSYFRPAAGCGSCSVMPGPVHPQGTCELFRKAN